MSGPGTMRIRPWHWLAIALVCAAGVWLYADRVLIPYQIDDAAAHGRPRGYLSDLYMHWLGARELFLNHKNPYSPEVAHEIQQGYYGRPLGRPGDPSDQRFAYPLYVLFTMAPVMRLPFEEVRSGFRVLFFLLTVAAVPLWLRFVGWRVSRGIQAALVVFTIGSLTVMQGLKLQQMTVLVAALIAIGVVSLARGRPVAAGVFLALATIKPQLVWLLLLCLAIWTVGDWRRRYQWITVFSGTMLVLCGAAEWFVPHWVPQFIRAMREYPSYTDAVSTFDKLMPAGWGWPISLLTTAATLYLAWKNRRAAEDSAAFRVMVALSLAVTILVIPSYALYNQILLLPGVFLLLGRWPQLRGTSRMAGGACVVAATLLAWTWLAAAVLAALSLVVPRRTVESAWAVPLWPVLLLPVVVSALVLITACRATFAPPVEPRSS